MFFQMLYKFLVKIFSKIELFSFEGSFKGWMKRIMVNTAIDKYRKRKNEPYPVEINENLNLTDNEDIISKMNKDDLLKLIQKLPTGYRTVFNMYVIEGYSHKEIAMKLEISEGTSKSQLFKAKQYLQKMIKDLFGENE